MFWYTGEGQVGNMPMVRGNAAITKHKADGKSILVFESTPKDQVRFLGEAEYLGHHKEQRPDRNGALREAIIFHLGFIPPVTLQALEQPKKAHTTSSRLSTKLNLSELRAIALAAASSDATIEQKQSNLSRRAEAIKRYALLRAGGECEACNQAAPFKAKSGPFLEVHHVFRLADGGPDHPANVVALCPNCHRRAHYSVDEEQFNEGLVSWLASQETT
jgi:5-methylcytosine-specific restriction protein A